MSKKPLVMLFGESILMDGVAASLAGSHRICVRREIVGGQDLTEYIRRTQPNMIVFELGTTSLESLLLDFCEQMNILLLGLDVDGQRAIVISGKQLPIETMRDLDSLLERETRLHAPVP